MLLIALTNSLLYSNVTVSQHAQYKELKSKQLKELRVKFNYIGNMLKKKERSCAFMAYYKSWKNGKWKIELHCYYLI